MSQIASVEHALLWAMLPEGLEDHFMVEQFGKAKEVFTIVLVEKQITPEELPEPYEGKKIVNTVLKEKTIDDFMIRGRKAELVIKRRYWKCEGIKELYKRDITLCVPGTKLEKEFASFLKELNRQFTDSNQHGSSK